MGRMRRGHGMGQALGVAAVLGAGAALAEEASTLPVEPATLTRARAIHALPCAGGPVPGFPAQAGAPAAWHVAGATVSVRLAGADRFAFVLGQPEAGGPDCPVRDVLVLPRSGMLLACSLPDHSLQGFGVHGRLADGRRDMLFWRGDGTGGLERPRSGEATLESDTGQLICALPDVIP